MYMYMYIHVDYVDQEHTLTDNTHIDIHVHS